MIDKDKIYTIESLTGRRARPCEMGLKFYPLSEVEKLEAELKEEKLQHSIREIRWETLGKEYYKLEKKKKNLSDNYSKLLKENTKLFKDNEELEKENKKLKNEMMQHIKDNEHNYREIKELKAGLDSCHNNFKSFEKENKNAIEIATKQNKRANDIR